MSKNPSPWHALRRHAKNCPYCMSCNEPNDGTIVAAHSNLIIDGKGIAHKAKDYRVAYVCHGCHQKIDVGGDRIMWLDAYYATLAYWFESGILTVKELEHDEVESLPF